MTQTNPTERPSSDTSQQPTEGRVTRTVEHYTAQVPSITWLGLAVGSMLISAGVAAFTNRKTTANFIGLWVPSLLLIGIYNKLVKLEGSDQFDRRNLH